MDSKRIPLDGEPEGEPLVMDVEEFRSGQDKSHMPGEVDPETNFIGRRTLVERRDRREMLEKEAVKRAVRNLRERGKSEDFIEDNMDAIRERVRKELYS